MARSSWIALLLLAVIALCGFDTRNPFRTRGPIRISDFTVGGGSTAWTDTFGPCTSGTDCFCDRVQGNGPLGTSDPIYNTNVFFCEDYDHDALTTTGTPSDPGGYGNWASATAGCDYGTGNRGCASYWNQKYLNGETGSGPREGEPSTPTVGLQCQIPSLSNELCYGYWEYRLDDAWDAIASGRQGSTWMDVIRTGEFDDENGSATPSIPGSGGADVFGDASFGHRVPANSSTGYHGAKSFGGTKSQLGISAAIGYESNLLTSRILGVSSFSSSSGSGAWKHDEFSPDSSGSNDDGLFGFNQNQSRSDTFPIHGLMFMSTCNSRVAAATVRRGLVSCNEGQALRFQADPTYYNAATDLTLNSWHCHKAYYDFRTISASVIQHWFDENLVLDFTIDLSGTNYDGANFDGVDGFAFNSYANANAGQGTPATTVATRRFSDNYVMREGTPVSCNDIGFSLIND